MLFFLLLLVVTAALLGWNRNAPMAANLDLGAPSEGIRIATPLWLSRTPVANRAGRAHKADLDKELGTGSASNRRRPCAITHSVPGGSEAGGPFVKLRARRHLDDALPGFSQRGFSKPSFLFSATICF